MFTATTRRSNTRHRNSILNSSLNAFLVAPYFLENTGYNVTTREHDNAVLRCHAGGNPQPKITWRREDSQVGGAVAS